MSDGITYFLGGEGRGGNQTLDKNQVIQIVRVCSYQFGEQNLGFPYP